MEVKPLQQVLEEMGEAVIHTVGNSMEPLLYARESTVLVRRKEVPCRKNDVVLYIRPNGGYALHRLVQTEPEYLAQGDNQLCREKISQAWVVGVMEGYHTHPDSPFCSVQSRKYKMYVQCLPVRRMWLRLKGLAARVVRVMRRDKHEV